ncbi:hypothetical protein [Mycobacterium innocens]|nr:MULTISPECIES: hypothetical protein [Mycobacterium]
MSQIQLGGDVVVELGDKCLGFGGAVAAVDRFVTVPLSTLNTANRMVTP